MEVDHELNVRLVVRNWTSLAGFKGTKLEQEGVHSRVHALFALEISGIADGFRLGGCWPVSLSRREPLFSEGGSKRKNVRMGKNTPEGSDAGRKWGRTSKKTRKGRPEGIRLRG